jgi:hypothetical protein
LAFSVADSTIAQVSLIVAGIGSLAVYMLAEGMTDKARAAQTKDQVEV